MNKRSTQAYNVCKRSAVAAVRVGSLLVASLALAPASGVSQTYGEFENPDLALTGLSYEIVEEGNLLVIVAGVENGGNAPTRRNTVARAISPRADWGAETAVPVLDEGQQVQVFFELGIRDELRGLSHQFEVAVDADGTITELAEDNNLGVVEVWIPPGPPGPPGPPEVTDGKVPAVLVVVAVVVLVLIVVASVTLTVRRSVKIRRRKDWQQNTEEEEPPETCRPCTRYCRKVELKLEPAHRKVAHLSLSAERPGSGGQAEERQVAGDIVDGLNDAVAASRRKEKPETLQRRVEPIALSLLQLITDWLRGEPAPRDVRVVGHIVGGKAECQFVLYHCERRGNVNVWEEEDKWKATVEDERDEAVGALPGLAPAEPSTPERLAGELARMLMRFIEKV